MDRLMSSMFSFLILVCVFLSCDVGRSRDSYKRVITENGYRDIVVRNDTIHVKEFDKNGKVEVIYSKYNGNYNGVYKKYNENSVVIAEMEYVNNQVQGLAIQYYDTGERYLQESFINNEPNGVATFFYKNGDIKAYNYWKDGFLYKVTTFDSERVERTEYYPKVFFSKDTIKLHDTLLVNIFFPKEYNDNLFFGYDFIGDSVDYDNLPIPDKNCELINGCDTSKVVFNQKGVQYLYGFFYKKKTGEEVKFLEPLFNKKLVVR